MIFCPLTRKSPCEVFGTHRAGRRARLIELDPKYVDVIVQRWQEATGGRAVLGSDGRAFDDLSSKRQAE
jgi:hypothetical protein